MPRDPTLTVPGLALAAGILRRPRCMDCPVGGDAAVQLPQPCVENAAEESGVEIARLELSGDGWRHEVATRLERYRARRKPRAPRYPSLRLPFDSADHWLEVHGSALAVSAPAPSTAVALEPTTEPDASHLVDRRPELSQEREPYTNLIEFPRSAAVPTSHANELAEPVFERPRIVEVPEVLPPPPALGGILMEPARIREPERRSAVSALAPAPLSRRMLAGLIDALHRLHRVYSRIAPGAAATRKIRRLGRAPPLAPLAGAGFISVRFFSERRLLVERARRGQPVLARPHHPYLYRLKKRGRNCDRGAGACRQYEKLFQIVEDSLEKLVPSGRICPASIFASTTWRSSPTAYSTCPRRSCRSWRRASIFLPDSPW